MCPRLASACSAPCEDTALASQVALSREALVELRQYGNDRFPEIGQAQDVVEAVLAQFPDRKYRMLRISASRAAAEVGHRSGVEDGELIK